VEPDLRIKLSHLKPNIKRISGTRRGDTTLREDKYKYAVFHFLASFIYT
jgi:hypothetical protein